MLLKAECLSGILDQVNMGLVKCILNIKWAACCNCMFCQPKTPQPMICHSWPVCCFRSDCRRMLLVHSVRVKLSVGDFQLIFDCFQLGCKVSICSTCKMFHTPGKQPTLIEKVTRVVAPSDSSWWVSRLDSGAKAVLGQPWEAIGQGVTLLESLIRLPACHRGPLLLWT